jgi:hypothetical protein
MDLPENAAQLKKFGVAMGATTSYSNNAIVSGGEYLITA